MHGQRLLEYRIVLACVVGLVSGLCAWYSHRLFLAQDMVPDSVFLWRAARIVLSGGDPYPIGAFNHLPVGERDLAAWRVAIEPLYYPMVAPLLWLLFASTDFLLGSALFTGAFCIHRLAEGDASIVVLR